MTPHETPVYFFESLPFHVILVADRFWRSVRHLQTFWILGKSCDANRNTGHLKGVIQNDGVLDADVLQWATLLIH